MTEENGLENHEGRKSPRAFESFRRRGIIEKPSRGDTVLTNSLILYGSVANRQLLYDMRVWWNGRHASLRGWWPQDRAGSSPVTRTKGFR